MPYQNHSGLLNNYKNKINSKLAQQNLIEEEITGTFYLYMKSCSNPHIFIKTSKFRGDMRCTSYMNY